MTSSAASDTDSARNCTPGPLGRDRRDHRVAARRRAGGRRGARRRVVLADQRDAVVDRPGLAHDFDRVAELGPHAGAEELVVVDEDDPALHAGHRGSRSSTSVPSPGALVTTALPPARSIRPLIDSRMPSPVRRHRRRIEAGAAVADEDGDLAVGHLGVDVDLLDAGELGGVGHRLARGGDERARRRRRAGSRRRSRARSRRRSAPRRRPRRAESAATSVAARLRAAVAPYSQARSSRSWRRASVATGAARRRAAG